MLAEHNTSRGRKRTHSVFGNFKDSSMDHPKTRKSSLHATSAINELYASGIEDSQVDSQTWVASVYEQAGRSVLVDSASLNTTVSPFQKDVSKAKQASYTKIHLTPNEDAMGSVGTVSQSFDRGIQTDVTIDDLNTADSLSEDLALAVESLEQQETCLRSQLQSQQEEIQQLEHERTDLRVQLCIQQREANANIARAHRDMRRLIQEWDMAVSKLEKALKGTDTNL
ncbi:hypothetical protein C8R42DRAFT_716808 [Lentinula raphanica]|nr:hypothetical protein C8R42DRAFT_716808 [Lentinula raphanica]